MSAAQILDSEGFGEEAVLTIAATGRTLRTNAGGIGDATFGGDYVRVVSADGREVAYWDCAEWAEDPQVVIGAIFGACAGIESSPVHGGTTGPSKTDDSRQGRQGGSPCSS